VLGSSLKTTYSLRTATAGTTGEIRLYDVTNAQQIQLQSFSTANVYSIYENLVYTNLPINAAVFEIQLRRSAGGNNDCYFGSLNLEVI
jgi:hypothetical protein